MTDTNKKVMIATKDLGKDFIDNVLSDLEKEKVAEFINDTTMREAVRKVLFAGLYHNGNPKPGEAFQPTRNLAFSLVANRGEFSDEQLGADLRATWEGVNALESAFGQMSKFKKEEETGRPSKSVNKAE